MDDMDIGWLNYGSKKNIQQNHYKCTEQVADCLLKIGKVTQANITDISRYCVGLSIIMITVAECVFSRFCIPQLLCSELF